MDLSRKSVTVGGEKRGGSGGKKTQRSIHRSSDKLYLVRKEGGGRKHVGGLVGGRLEGGEGRGLGEGEGKRGVRRLGLAEGKNAFGFEKKKQGERRERGSWWRKGTSHEN